MIKYIKNVYKYLTTDPVSNTRIDLLWMDLKESGETPEIYFMEGYDQYRQYFSSHVYFKNCYKKGPYKYEVYNCIDNNIEFVCDETLITIYRDEEVLKSV